MHSSTNRTALITGITGQDGAYLAKYLLDMGYTVVGCRHHASPNSLWRLEKLGIRDDLQIIDLELLEDTSIETAIMSVKPDEMYNLAAQSSVASSFKHPVYTSKVTGLSVAQILETIRTKNSHIKFYQASTSEMFAIKGGESLNEASPFFPVSPYATAKLYAHWMTINYRTSFNLFACSGILFNHESPLRGITYVSRKITHGLALIKAGRIPFIELGNVDAVRDWGYAEEYVRGIHMMLQHDVPDDYVLATGQCHSIREFISTAASICGWSAEWSGQGFDEVCIDKKTGRQLVKINPNLYRPIDVDLSPGNATKAGDILGWYPKVGFEKLVTLMMEEDLKFLR